MISYVDHDSIKGPKNSRFYKTIMIAKFDHGGMLTLVNHHEANCSAQLAKIIVGFISKDGGPLREVPESRNRVMTSYPTRNDSENNLFNYVCEYNAGE